jgi:hypothetical protein
MILNKLKTLSETEEGIVTHLKTLVIALGVTLWLPVAAQSETSIPPAETPSQSAETSSKPAETPAVPAKCLEAAVNPVTGFAVCVNPRGAPVDPPPASSFHPCKSRPQDKEAWTVYEHSSGCDD